MSPILQAGNHIASAFMTLAVSIAVVGIVAYLCARAFGARSRPLRRAIFSIVGAVGLIVAVIFFALQVRR